MFDVFQLTLQEIEEDKKKAEQEGIAVTTPRKPRPHDAEPDRRKTEKENITVTVDLSRQTGVSYRVDLLVFKNHCQIFHQNILNVLQTNFFHTANPLKSR